MAALWSILTGNLGAEVFSKGPLGFGDTGRDQEACRRAVIAEAKNSFRQELLGRLDEIIVFQPLQKDSLIQIAALQVEQLCRRAAALRVDLAVSSEVIAYLARLGSGQRRRRKRNSPDSGTKAGNPLVGTSSEW